MNKNRKDALGNKNIKTTGSELSHLLKSRVRCQNCSFYWTSRLLSFPCQYDLLHNVVQIVNKGFLLLTGQEEVKESLKVKN